MRGSGGGASRRRRSGEGERPRSSRGASRGHGRLVQWAKLERRRAGGGPPRSRTGGRPWSAGAAVRRRPWAAGNGMESFPVAGGNSLQGCLGWRRHGAGGLTRRRPWRGGVRSGRASRVLGSEERGWRGQIEFCSRVDRDGLSGDGNERRGDAWEHRRR